MNTPDTFNNRILIIDDNPAIHRDFRKILCTKTACSTALLAAEQRVFADAAPGVIEPLYEIDSAHQGQEGMEMIRLASSENRPYALAFVDVRMAPGMDGIQSIKAFWKEFPDLQVVVCSAYSDYSWEDMLVQLGLSCNLLILKKPFGNIEVRQAACALTTKWNEHHVRGAFEKEQRRLTEELKAKNGELVAARHAAEDANVAKSAFLANMSHEIRTPINVIMGYNYLFHQSELTERQKTFATKIDVAANSLLQLINSILDISKVEAGKIELERIEFDLEAVLSKLAQMTYPSVQQKGLEFKVVMAPGTPTRLIGDPLRLEQVLLNLATNAVKFTDAGDVEVGVELQERTDGAVVLKFKIRDGGIGMRPSQHLKVFEPFVQAEPAITRKHGGTGLGLAIAKQFVALMDGKIAVESQPGKGSLFSFTARFGEQSKPELALTAGKRQRALLIGSVSASRAKLAGILAELDYEVTSCEAGEYSPLEIARGGSIRPSNFDVLFADASESQKDWLREVIRIHNDFSDRISLKIILFSGGDGSGDGGGGGGGEKNEHEPLGIGDIVVKPWTRSSVRDAITRAQSKGSRPPGRGPRPYIELKGARILLVEDDEINQQIACEVLGVAGCEVTVAASGTEALQQVFGMKTDDRFHVVLMDLQMPGMDGLTAARRIRAEKRYANLPIIALTANAIQGVESNCLAAGMDDYLTKPINPDQLFAALERWIPASRKSIPSNGETRPGDPPI